jgi:hypothetical protein
MLSRNLTASLCATLDERTSSIHELFPAPAPPPRQDSAEAKATVAPARQGRHWLRNVAWLPIVMLAGALLLTGWLPALFILFALLLPALAPLLLALVGMLTMQ